MRRSVPAIIGALLALFWTLRQGSPPIKAGHRVTAANVYALRSRLAAPSDSAEWLAQIDYSIFRSDEPEDQVAGLAALAWERKRKSKRPTRRARGPGNPPASGRSRSRRSNRR